MSTKRNYTETRANLVCGLLALASLLWLAPTPGFSQDISVAPSSASSASFSQLISSVETAAGVPSDLNAPLPDRMTAVELKLFGAPQNGPLNARIQRAQQALTARRNPPAVQHLVQTDQLQLFESLPGSNNSLGDSLPLLNAVPPNFLRIEPLGTPVDQNADYLSVVVKDGKILRFKNMPIPVFVNQYPDKLFVRCVLKAFETWEDRTLGSVRFVQVDDAEKARIQVAWKRLGRAEDRTGCMLGAHTITKYTNNGKGTMTVIGVGGVPVPLYIPRFGPKYTVPPQVIEVNLDLIMQKNPIIRYRLLQNVVTHELGHALGISGHSQNNNDIMYPVTDEHSRVSQRDVNTLMRLYQQKVDVPL